MSKRSRFTPIFYSFECCDCVLLICWWLTRIIRYLRILRGNFIVSSFMELTLIFHESQYVYMNLVVVRYPHLHLLMYGYTSPYRAGGRQGVINSHSKCTIWQVWVNKLYKEGREQLQIKLVYESFDPYCIECFFDVQKSHNCLYLLKWAMVSFAMHATCCTVECGERQPNWKILVFFSNVICM